MKQLIFLLPLLVGCTVYRTDRPSVVIHEGRFEFRDEEVDFQETSIEYRAPHNADWHIRPMFGLTYAAKDGDRAYTPYIGGLYDLDVGAQWTLSPGFGLAYYNRENDMLPDLGSSILFRSSLSFTRQLTNNLSLGMSWIHMSNGNILGDENPGADSLTLTVGWTF